MRITDGRYYATSREGIQRIVDRKNEELDELIDRLETVAAWADANMDLHVPYVSGRIDVSCPSADKRQADLLEQMKRNLWCSECGTSWPCKKIDALKSLRDFAQGRGPADFKMAIEKITPKVRAGQVPEVCL